jgi:DedD protein
MDMQWLKDEKIKHRIVGLAVLLSIVIVVLPAMIKKSNQRLDQNMNLSIQVPPKPSFPDVAAVKPTILFKSVKVAHIVIAPVAENKNDNKIAPAASLSGKTMASRSLLQKAPILAKNTNHATVSHPKEIAANVKQTKLEPRSTKIIEQKSGVFSVQLASFSQQVNAQSLVQSLNRKGFHASYDKQGNLYRVLVGQLSQLEQAKTLQKQLISQTQMTGFIVKVG